MKSNIIYTILVLLSGCSISVSQPSPNSDNARLNQERQIVYECNNNYEFSAQTDLDKATLYLPEGTVTLNRVSSASGIKYAGSNNLFWNKGDNSLLEIDGQSYSCQRNTEREPRITKGTTAVDFRAVGNEPGWIIEITDSHSIRILTDYGNNYVATPAPLPQLTKETTIYEAQTEAHEVKIVIEQKPCADTMSGEMFASTVTLYLDGETFTGCGNRLI